MITKLIPVRDNICNKVQNLELTVLQPSLYGHALSNLSLNTFTCLHYYYALRRNVIMQLVYILNVL